MKSLYIDIKRKMLTTEGERFLIFKDDFKKGEFISLVGQSGSGKSTLLRILAGLIMPDEGLVKYGEDIWFDSKTKKNMPPQKRNIAYMFQDFALFPNMNVEQNISYAQKEKDKEMVKYLIDIFGLHNLEKVHPIKLSGGQKQRVALARALASKPSVLLLDEPLSSIDWHMRESLQDEILKAHTVMDGISIIVTHDKEESEQMRDRLISLT